MVPPVMSIFAFLTAEATCSKLRLNALSFDSSTAISISSSGNPLSVILEIPPRSRKSSSIFLAVCLSDFNETPLPLMVKPMAGLRFSFLKTTIGSMSPGKDAI